MPASRIKPIASGLKEVTSSLSLVSLEVKAIVETFALSPVTVVVVETISVHTRQMSKKL